MKIRHCFGMLTIMTAVVAMVSCSKNTVDDYPMGMTPKSMSPTGLTLGNRLANAYTVRNMTAAWYDLFGNDGRCPLGATHYYVKILPQDSTDVTRLVEDTTLCLFPYPLDYELIGEGMYELDSTDTAWVYTVVPVGYNLSGLTYTVIDTCCIPDDGDTLLERVEERSLKLTGNIPRNQPRVSGKPSGRFQVWNTQTRAYEGVRGVKVVMNTIVRIRKVFTNENGNYYCPTKFLSNVAYNIFYDNVTGFKLWYNWGQILPASLYVGVHSPTGYSYNMGTSSGGWYLSTVNNATRIFYTILCPSMGVSIPPSDLRIFAHNMDMSCSTPMFYHRAYPNSEIDSFAMYLLPDHSPFYFYRLIKILPDIFITTSGETTEWMYSCMFHELSHALHHKRAGNSYWHNLVIGEISNNILWGDPYYSGNPIYSGYIGVAEMWAYYSEYILNNYYWIDINHLSDSTTMYQQAEWFRPGLLDTLSNNVPTMTYDYIYNSLTTEENSMCKLKEKLVWRTPIAYRHTTNSILNPICSTTY